jgi:plastocyanin
LKVTALALAVAGVASVAALPAAAATTPIFTGSVGPGFTISLAKKPTKAGKVTLTIADKSSIHNFHLRGPGGRDIAAIDAKTKKAVKKIDTGVGPVGTRSYILTLAKGTYTFVCDPHLTSMKGSFTVK